MKEWFKKVYDLGLPLNVHANGDAAIDMLLRAHEYAAAGDLAKDRHVTVIHSQFVRADQLAKYKAYSITPSLYTEHTFYFGDTHVLNRGKEQAFFESPIGQQSTRDCGPPITRTSWLRPLIRCS